MLARQYIEESSTTRNYVDAMTLQERIQKIWSGSTRWQMPLAEYSTLGVGGPATAVVEPVNEKELRQLIGDLDAASIPWLVIGRGSNILFADQGFHGVVIVLGSNFADIVVTQDDGEKVIIKVEAGCSLARLLNWCADQGFAGLEFAAGIPGSVGGAIIMNAGAWEREIKDVLVGVSYLDALGNLAHTERSAMDFAYRSWLGGQDKVVVSGEFMLTKADRQEIRRRCQDLTAQRRAKQPKVAASAGSFFKNPTSGPAAGRLIEDAGLKGLRVGGACVSPAHANFIVNDGGATAADILALKQMVQDKVRDMFGISLQPEVHIIEAND